jgi:hypothetical protein
VDAFNNESSITIHSNPSLADHYSNDAASSHDSLSTIATLEDTRKKSLSPVTQKDFQKSSSNNKDQLETNEDYRTHKRHLSRSSVISTRSYDSTASNYDMLLARLDSKDTLVPIPTFSHSIDKDEDDWGKFTGFLFFV